MVLNRKSAKKTSNVSLFIAVAMIGAIFASLQTQGYQVDVLAQTGVNLCKLGFNDIVTALFW
ncbi:hypothetical protein [Aliikangiella sp. IMCC44359]|uniref:hypothetical protein n=1 Tax=Aliikangiella sp. IMCC44359 TaxID=3459125 RepID=UPI00403AD0E8